MEISIYSITDKQRENDEGDMITYSNVIGFLTQGSMFVSFNLDVDDLTNISELVQRLRNVWDTAMYNKTRCIGLEIRIAEELSGRRY